MSSVIYYWTDARQHGIYLLSRWSPRRLHNKATEHEYKWLDKRYIWHDEYMYATTNYQNLNWKQGNHQNKHTKFDSNTHMFTFIDRLTTKKYINSIPNFRLKWVKYNICASNIQRISIVSHKWHLHVGFPFLETLTQTGAVHNQGCKWKQPILEF